MLLTQWTQLFTSPLDAVGFAVFVLVFPVYHSVLYPLLMGVFPNHAVKARLDAYRRSWIEHLVTHRDVVTAAQQTRNLTMVNTFLASSALILMGFTSNVLLNAPKMTADVPALDYWQQAPQVLQLKLLLLIAVFGVSFAYCMTSLRHLGHFNLVIGADPQVIEAHEGSAVDYLAALINKASNRSTMSVRCLYSATPLFTWLFDPYLFVLITSVWAIKFVVFQDFAHVLRGRRWSDLRLRSRPAR